MFAGNYKGLNAHNKFIKQYTSQRFEVCHLAVNIVIKYSKIDFKINCSKLILNVSCSK